MVVDTALLRLGASVDILQNQDQVAVDLQQVRKDESHEIGLTAWPHWKTATDLGRPLLAALTDQESLQLTPATSSSNVPAQPHCETPTAPHTASAPDESSRLEHLFPNSFKITGFKHIADNALGAILQAIPMWGALLPRLQSLDCLLNLVTWREPFIHCCMASCSDLEKGMIKKWSGPKLGGLRWEVVSNFCAEDAWEVGVFQFLQCCSGHWPALAPRSSTSRSFSASAGAEIRS